MEESRSASIEVRAAWFFASKVRVSLKDPTSHADVACDLLHFLELCADEVYRSSLARRLQSSPDSGSLTGRRRRLATVQHRSDDASYARSL